MLLQWLACIVMALVATPRTWVGASSELHPHVMMAVLGGGVLAVLPIAMAVFHAGRTSTRMVIASPLARP